jgi:predicted permease
MLTSLKQIFRGLVKSPAFSLTVVASIGLGIAANVVLFSLADSLFFRPLTPHEPERLVYIYSSYKNDLRWGSTSFPDYRDLRDGCSALSPVSAEGILALSIGVGSYNQRITGSIVSPNYFQVLGVPATLGRVFDDRKGEDPTVIVLSHKLWQRDFGADPGLVGRTLAVNGTPFTVLGVMPESFTGAVVGYDPQFWVPSDANNIVAPGSTFLERRGLRSLFVLGRMAPGATIASVAAQLDNVAAHLTAAYPKTNTGISFTVIPAAEGALHPLYRSTFKTVLGLLFAVVGIVLLTVCANVAGLMLARAHAGRQEIALRLALGGRRPALIRLRVAESLVLSVLGAGLALLVEALVNRVLGSMSPVAELPIGLTLSLDYRVFAFTAAMALLAGLLFGLAPALQSTRLDIAETIKHGAQASGFRRSRLRTLFVFGQTMFAAILLVATLLVLRGLQRAGTLDLGLKPDRVASAAVDLSLRNYDGRKCMQFYRSFTEQLARLPQVASVTLASSMPLDPFSAQAIVLPAEANPTDTTKRHVILANNIYPGYFRTLGIAFLRGRDFTPADGEHDRAVAIVNRQFANLFWPGSDPVGKTVRSDGTLVEIVGVVADTKTSNLAEPPQPAVFVPLLQQWRPTVDVLVLTQGRPEAVFPALRQTLRDLDPSLALFKVQTLRQHLELLVLIPKIGAAILGGFGIFTMALAGLGLYGAVAYNISQRSREIGIRIALGATRANILRVIVGEGMRLTAVAVASGLLLAAVLTRFMTTFLFSLSPLDPLAYAGAAAVILTVIGLACYLSARNILGIDPSIALKDTI